MDTEKRFCKNCNWNDSNYGCTCPVQEQVYQCLIYIYYQQKVVKELEKSINECVEQRQKEQR